MSRIGKKPIPVPSGVKVELAGDVIKVSGSAATLTMDIHPTVAVSYDEGAKEVSVTRKGDERLQRAMHGTTRALINNMIIGVTQGYKKAIQIFGTGYGVKVQGKEMQLTVGYAKPACLNIPDGVTVDIETPNSRGNDVPALFIIVGPDKHKVGQFAAAIRKVRPPEPYKGKGIRYKDEHIRRKVGKAFGSA